MNRYGPTPREAAAIAKASGCKLVRTEQLHDGTFAHEIACDSHKDKVRFLANLAEYDAQLPDLRRLAERIVAGASTTAEQAARLQTFVQRRVTFTPEVRETFSSTWRTLEQGLGDCDDSSRALLALMRSLGMAAGLKTIPDLAGTEDPVHVAPVLRQGASWVWLEPSIPAQFGEHPQAAARRLKSNRAELGALNPDDDQPDDDNGKGLEVKFAPDQVMAFVGAGMAVISAMVYPPAAPALLTIGGAAAGFGVTRVPFMWEFQLPDGYVCSAWLPGVEEEGRGQECERRFSYLKGRNVAIGAALGALAGFVMRRWAR